MKADRIGDQVQLHWTTPAKTTDGQAIKGALSASICREDGIVKGKKEPVCTPVQTVGVAPGPSQAADLLHGALVTDPAGVIGYRVSILNAKGRSAGPSKVVYAAAGAAPGPVAGLHVAGRATGVEIAWEKGRDEVEVSRKLVLDTDGKPPAVKAGSNGELGGHRGENIQVELVPKAIPDCSLQDRPSIRSPAPRADSGGLEDQDAIHGMLETYEYTAWRVRTVYGPDDCPLAIRGPISAPIRYTVRDIFPPHVPRGLAAVSGLAGTHSVDLSWQPVPDADLAGYVVYRRTALDGDWVRLTPSPNPATAYQDATVAAGQAYYYRVTAVDQTGNESKPGSEIVATPEP